ncbi:MAG TPA: hypothetical protein PKO45_13410, partial [Rubrivivax sp.]|nr:hypothetical protein [Rubrivivax sp.]
MRASTCIVSSGERRGVDGLIMAVTRKGACGQAARRRGRGTNMSTSNEGPITSHWRPVRWRTRSAFQRVLVTHTISGIA